MHGCTTATPNRLCVCASSNLLDMQLYPLDRQALSGMLTCKDSPILRAWTILNCSSLVWMQDSDTLAHAMFNQHLHYDSNSKPAMQRRWSGDNLGRKLIAEKHLQHCSIHPFQLSKLPFWHILFSHRANKEWSVQALSKAPASSPRDLEEAPSNDAGSHSLRKHHKFLYVVLIMLLMPLRFPKKEVETWQIFIKVRITWSGCLLSFNWVIDLLEILSFRRNTEKQYIRFTVNSHPPITMLRLVLPGLTRRLSQSLANLKQKNCMAQSDHMRHDFPAKDWNWHSYILQLWMNT